MIGRRTVLVAIPALAFAGAGRVAADGPTVVVTKDPDCGCCSGWADHLKQAGFTVTVRNVSVTDLHSLKTRLGVPPDLIACHTAQVAGYVIEGHVPAPALRRFLNQRPKAKGLAVKGMPIGSPGMESPGSEPEEYSVILIGPERRVYARFKGAVELSN